jgi:hypothetical protein
LALSLRLADDKYSERADHISELPNSLSQIRFSSWVRRRVALRCINTVIGAASIITPDARSIGVFGSSNPSIAVMTKPAMPAILSTTRTATTPRGALLPPFLRAIVSPDAAKRDFRARKGPSRRRSGIDRRTAALRQLRRDIDRRPCNCVTSHARQALPLSRAAHDRTSPGERNHLRALPFQDRIELHRWAASEPGRGSPGDTGPAVGRLTPTVGPSPRQSPPQYQHLPTTVGPPHSHRRGGSGGR